MRIRPLWTCPAERPGSGALAVVAELGEVTAADTRKPSPTQGPTKTPGLLVARVARSPA